MLVLTNWTASVEEKEILHGLSLEFAPGKIYAVMGPNGSGKSTLARSVMGDPTFEMAGDARIVCDDTDLSDASADVRARAGVFLSAQSPLAIPGVSVRELIRTALKDSGRPALEVKKELEAYAAELKIPDELLNRSLNDGFSGGERKKMEVLQMAMLAPRYIFLDEIDTGVDVDALATITAFLKKFVNGTDRTLVMITHYNRILTHLTPEETLVLKDGVIVTRGDAALAREIEDKGFDHL